MEYIIMEEKDEVGFAGIVHMKGGVIGKGFKTWDAAWLSLGDKIHKRIHRGEPDFILKICSVAPDGPTTILEITYNETGVTPRLPPPGMPL